MPRRPRQKRAGLIHHVVHRGINRQTIFRDAHDYALYLHVLTKMSEKYAVKILAYCLMTNHLHLMLEDSNCAISELMHALNGYYTTKFNKRHQCEGALLRGRFYSAPVVDDRYELALFRYIHLNPVKAGMVTSPEGYRWSSYRNYLGREIEFPVARERLLQKLRKAGVDGDKIQPWMCTHCAPLDAVCKPEALNTWQQGRIFTATNVANGSPLWSSPLLNVEAWQKSHPKSQRGPDHDREALLIAACCEVAQCCCVMVHELAAPTRGGDAGLARARGAAMLFLRNRHKASHAELARFFCLAKESIGVTLTRARHRASEEELTAP